MQPYAVCDVDGDGHADAIGSVLSNEVDVWRGHGDGTFERTPIATGKIPRGSITGDVDGDGRCDLLISSASGQFNTINVAYGQADATFKLSTAGATFPTSSMVRYVGDLNHDGRLDLAAMQNTTEGYVQYEVFLGQPSGFLGVATIEPFVANPSIALGFQPFADVDGDGNADIAVPLQISTSPATTIIAIAYGTGDGHFKTSSVPNAVPGIANGVFLRSLADFDHDGRADVLAEDTSSQVFWSEGGGKFTAGPRFQSSYLADFNADGAVDVFANYSSGSGPTMGLITLYAGGRTFANYPNPIGGADIIADIDGDGATDIMFPGAFRSIYLSTAKHPGPATPDIQCGSIPADQCTGPASF